jgi:hypothetical protein
MGVISGAAQYGDSNVKDLLESGINTNIQTSADIIGNNLVVNNDLTIKGTLNLEGDIINTQTEVQISDQLIVTNTGTGPAVKINQKGENAIIDIQDDDVSSFYIKNGGNVGIGTTEPTEKLEVDGKIKLKDSLIINNQYRTLECDNQNLTAWYKFDGDFTDSSGNGNDLTTYSGNPTTSITQFKFGQSAYLISSSLKTNDFTFHNKVFSISVWIFTTGSSNRLYNLISQNYAEATNQNLHIRVNKQSNTSIKYTMAFWANDLNSSSGYDDLNKWVHIVFQINSNGYKEIWRNGVMIANDTNGSFLNTNNADIVIGNWTQDNKYFEGYLDNLRIYDKALTITEISLLYNKVDFKGSYNDLNNKLVFSTDYFINNNNSISLNAGAIAGLSINNQGDNIIIDEFGKIHVGDYITEEDKHRYPYEELKKPNNIIQTIPNTFSIESNDNIYTSAFDENSSILILNNTDEINQKEYNLSFTENGLIDILIVGGGGGGMGGIYNDTSYIGSGGGGGGGGG